MLFGQGIFGLAVLALWAYCIFDVIRTDDSSIQNLPKMFWLLIVIFIPTIGSIAWLLLGRPTGARWELREPQQPRRSGPAHPAGHPEPPVRPSSSDHAAKREEALRRYMAEREADLRKREEEVRRLEEELLRKNHPPGPETNDQPEPDQK